MSLKKMVRSTYINQHINNYVEQYINIIFDNCVTNNFIMCIEKIYTIKKQNQKLLDRLMEISQGK